MNSKDYYIDQYKQYHQDAKVYPGDMQYDFKFISQLVKDYNAETLLDFGCGKGYQYTKDQMHIKHFGGIMPTLYDPAVSTHDQLPEGKFDGVICCDVMEHVPEVAVLEVLQQIYSKADKFVFIAASNTPAIAVLPNGENAHITLKPFMWWIEKIKPFTNNVPTMFVIRGVDRFVSVMQNGELLAYSKF